MAPPTWLDAASRPRPTRACWTCGREVAPMRDPDARQSRRSGWDGHILKTRLDTGDPGAVRDPGMHPPHVAGSTGGGGLFMSSTRASRSLAIGLALLLASPFTASAIVQPQSVNPDDFSVPLVIDNHYFPLVPGTLLVYEGERDGVPTHSEFCVTRQTKVIEGVETRVVHDQAFEKDVLSEKYVLVEDMFDWHAQDNSGTVWYFGEDTKELDADGNIVSTEGSWEAGVDGAKAGFIMLADPQVGVRYYQEFSRNVAEDQAKVLGLDETVALNVNGKDVTYENVLLTQETSRLDSGVLEYKYYARGVGLIRSVIVKRGRVHGAGPYRALQLTPQTRNVPRPRFLE